MRRRPGAARKLSRSIATVWRAAAAMSIPTSACGSRAATRCSAPDYVDALRHRGELVRAMDALLGDFDCFVWPTTPIVAPTIAEMEDVKMFATKNMLLLRNTNRSSTSSTSAPSRCRCRVTVCPVV